ncbi:hypothetical protein X772_30370 [Mesorhizobium sp. LSJC280B00]|nr:hypothetical protein X772_30370 [Mesorhizobium sp. LSJC280B00]
MRTPLDGHIRTSYKAESHPSHPIHAVDDLAKNWPFKEICVFVAQKIAQYVAPFKIHAAARNVTVWEKNIPILPSVNARQRADDWLPWFDDLRIDASTPAAQRPRAN